MVIVRVVLLMVVDVDVVEDGPGTGGGYVVGGGGGGGNCGGGDAYKHGRRDLCHVVVEPTGRSCHGDQGG